MLFQPPARGAIVRLIGLATAIVFLAMPAASAAQDIVSESISLNFSNFAWDLTTKARIEADFRRIVAEKGLKVAPAEIAGAAQAAFAAAAAAGSGTHHDNWDQPAVIRGCGPAKQLCFVIICEGCRR